MRAARLLCTALHCSAGFQVQQEVNSEYEYEYEYEQPAARRAATVTRLPRDIRNERRAGQGSPVITNYSVTTELRTKSVFSDEKQTNKLEEK